MVDEATINRIRNLLRKAESSEFEAESETFEKKALELMALYELQYRDLAEEDNPDIKEFLIDLSEHGNFTLGVAILYSGIIDIYGGFTLFASGKKRERKGSKILVYATQDQMDRATVLIEFFIRQMQYHFVVAKASSRKSFSKGWAVEVANRLKLANQEVYMGLGALVPTNDRAYEHAANIHGSFGTFNSGETTSDETLGRVKGSEADLGQDKIGS